MSEVGSRRIARREIGQDLDNRVPTKASAWTASAANAAIYSARAASAVNADNDTVTVPDQRRPSSKLGRYKVPVSSALLLVALFAFLIFVFPVAVLGCFQDQLLAHAGVRPSKDGLSVFNYNPGHLSSGVAFLVIFVLPSMVKRALIVQTIVFVLLTGVCAFFAAILTEL